MPYFLFLQKKYYRGFCGTRTLPFEKPIEVGRQAEGIYLDYRFTSDDEPDRRVWKITTRSEQSRGEQLYQAMFNLSVAPTTNDNDVEEEEWTRTEIPFRTFQQVRGPRLIEGAPKLDVTNGLYQIGLSLSKFMISKNVTEIPNFRPGYFELQIKEIGIYTRQEKEEEEDVKIPVPTTLSKSEIAKRRPLLLKILLPIAKLFFSEKRYVLFMLTVNTRRTHTYQSITMHSSNTIGIHILPFVLFKTPS